MKTFAFARKEHPTDVRLWCRRSARGRSLLWVINGAWAFNPDVDEGYLLIWEGEVPEDFKSHYNDAIKWIQERVDGDHEH